MAGRKRRGTLSLVIIILTIYVVISVFPFLWMLNTSLKTSVEANSLPITLIPHDPTIQGYFDLFTLRPFASYIGNSIWISFFTIVILFFLGIPAAYGFSRFKFRMQGLFLVFILATRMIPPVSLVIPFFGIAQRLGILDTKFVLVLGNLYMNLPFAIWLWYGFFSAIPESLFESARIDGASELSMIARILIPVSKASIASVVILVFMFIWNEFLFAVSLTSSPVTKPLTVGLFDFVGDRIIDWPVLCASGVIGTLPGLIFGLSMQRYITSGVLSGSVKG